MSTVARLPEVMPSTRLPGAELQALPLRILFPGEIQGLFT